MSFVRPIRAKHGGEPVSTGKRPSGSATGTRPSNVPIAWFTRFQRPSGAVHGWSSPESPLSCMVALLSCMAVPLSCMVAPLSCMAGNALPGKSQAKTRLRGGSSPAGILRVRRQFRALAEERCSVLSARLDLLPIRQQGRDVDRSEVDLLVQLVAEIIP